MAAVPDPGDLNPDGGGGGGGASAGTATERVGDAEAEPRIDLARRLEATGAPGPDPGPRPDPAAEVGSGSVPGTDRAPRGPNPGLPAAAGGGAAVALGVDLGGTKIEAVLLAPDGTLDWRQRVATPAGDYAATVAAVAALVAQARAAAGAGLTIGVGTPGAATAAGLMKNCNSTCLNGQPLQRDLEAAIGLPLALANDADCLALSEASDGAGAGAAVVFAAIVGTGTGAGIAVDARVLRGPNGLTGEWGHNPLPWADADEAAAPCYCGRSGCIEALVSGPALARDHAARHGGTLTAAAIAGAADAGDAACRATLERHAHRLARALAGVINLLDPDVIVLGGGLSLMPHLYHRVPALWPRWVLGAASGDALRTRLLPALHGDASGVRGAAWLGRALPRSAPGRRA